jgi:WD40-like Beta Propeller Repeat
VFAALAAACVLGASCTSASESGAGRQVRRPPAHRAEPARFLEYLRGSELHRLDISTGADETIARLESPDAQAAFDSPWIASVADAEPSGDGEDFASAPVLRLVDPASGRTEALGPGVAPLWSPDGSRLAWLRPVGNRRCDAEACRGRLEVVAMEASTMQPRTLLPAGRWGLLAWAGEALLVADQADLATTTRVAPGGDSTSVNVPPQELWGASPEGDWLVRVDRRGVDMLRARAGAPTGRSIPVARGSEALAEGSWSPGSARLAAVEVATASGGIPAAHVIVVEPGSPPRRVAGSRAATGPVLWSPDGRAIAFARPTGPHGGRLEGVLCGLGPGRRCRSLLSWTEGVVLLRLT